ncbi:MAG TPA: amino acid permease [Sphingomicrobium sp.]|nr:amino acid permease [Sphingomicrobium sp.]
MAASDVGAADLIDPAINLDPPASERQLGLPMATALIVGNMIGAGIFLLPSQLAPYGRTAFYGWLVTIAGVLCLALVLLALSRRIPGGPFIYVERAFGPLAAFLIMWSYLVGIWTGLPAIAIPGVSYLSLIEPALGRPLVAPCVTVAAIWAVVAINARGARSGGMVQLVTSVLKVLPLIAVALVAAAAFGGGGHAAEQSNAAFSGGSLAGAAALALFSMLGFECATMSTDKIRDPERNVPLSTIIGPVLTGLTYIAAYASVLFLLSGTRTAASPAPFAEAIAPLLGHEASTAVALFAAISAFGCLNGWLLVAGEVALTMARDGVLPAWLGKTTRIGTPVRAQVVAGIAATLLVVANYSKSMGGLFTFAALITTVSNLFLYAAVATAAVMLVRKLAAPFWLVPVALLALAFSLWAFYGAGAEPSLWGLALLASGLPIYWFMRRRGGSSRAAAGAPVEPEESSV